MIAKVKTGGRLKNESSRLLLPHIPSDYGNQPEKAEDMVAKTANEKIRPVSGFSSGDDSEIKEFKRKIKENK